GALDGAEVLADELEGGKGRALRGQLPDGGDGIVVQGDGSHASIIDPVVPHLKPRSRPCGERRDAQDDARECSSERRAQSIDGLSPSWRADALSAQRRRTPRPATAGRCPQAPRAAAPG